MKNKCRVIARLDIKNEFVIKGIQLEGLRKIANANELAVDYYEKGIDEIIFMDAVAAYYDRNSLSNIIDQASTDIFVPITVGGGIRNIEDIKQALKAGADKVAINTQAVRTPSFITQAAKIFGSQCIVASIVVKKTSEDFWEVYTENGREPSGKNALSWAVELENLGAGEIMLTSIDQEGTKKGLDKNLIEQLNNKISIPLIASGGIGTLEHLDTIHKYNLDGICLASLLHYKINSIKEVKEFLIKENLIRVEQ